MSGLGRKVQRQVEKVSARMNGQDLVPVELVKTVKANTLMSSLACAGKVLTEKFAFSTEQVQIFANLWVEEIKKDASDQAKRG